eukprot:2872041-Prymnesium_polylepis.2
MAAEVAAWSSSPFLVLRLPSAASSEGTSETTSQPGTFSNASRLASFNEHNFPRTSGPASRLQRAVHHLCRHVRRGVSSDRSSGDYRVKRGQCGRAVSGRDGLSGSRTRQCRAHVRHIRRRLAEVLRKHEERGVSGHDPADGRNLLGGRHSAVARERSHCGERAIHERPQGERVVRTGDGNEEREERPHGKQRPHGTFACFCRRGLHVPTRLVADACSTV